MSASRVFTLSAVMFLLGVMLFSWVGFSWLVTLLLLLGAVAFGIADSKLHQSKFILVALVFFCLLAGVLRAGFYRPAAIAGEKFFWNEARQYLVGQVSQVLPLPESAVFSAMVFGYEKNIPQDLKNNFNRTGTRHILAISGMNISIVALMLLNFGLVIGLWRRQAFWLALFGILVYILLAGSPASAVRAGLMSAILLWAQNQGRLVLAWRPVLAAAFLMVFLDPTLLNFSVGFQLSFLAVLGIIFFKNFWLRVFAFVKFKFLQELLALSMAAQITTWPVILHNFGTISVIGPIANIFVVPLLTPVMFLGLVFMVVAPLGVFLSKMVLWPVWFILFMVDKLVYFFGSLGWASVSLGKMGLALVVIYYLLLVLLWRFLDKRRLNDPVV